MRRVSLVVGLVLLSWSIAGAQTILPAAPMIPVLPPIDKDEPVSQTRPRGQVEVGPVKIRPGFAISDVGVDTNVFNERTDRKQDFTATAGPTAEAQLEISRFRLTGTGALGYVYYNVYDTQRGLNRTATGTAEFRASRRILLYANQVFRNTRERLNFEVDARARRAERGVQAGVQVEITPKVTAELSGAYGTRRYASDETILGFKLNETLNEDSRNAAARLALKATRLTTFFLTAESNQSLFPLSPDRDRYSFTTAVGAAFKPRALVSGVASVGFQRATLLKNQGLDYSGVYANLGLRHKPKEGTELGVGFLREQSSSFEPDHPYAIANSTGASLRQHLFKNVDLYLEAIREARSYAQSPLLHDSRWAGTDVGYRYNATIGVTGMAQTRLDLNVQYIKRSSERTTGRVFDGLRVGANFSVGRFRVGNR
jgi:hypothetical protein